MSTAETQPVPLAALENPLEADLLSALLEEAGVAHRIRVYNDSASAGAFSVGRPWGAVEALPSRRALVLRLLKAVRQGGTPGDPQAHPVPEPVV